MGEITKIALLQPMLFGMIFVASLISVIYIIKHFKIKWKGFLPMFEARKNNEVEELKAKIVELEEKIKFSKQPDFFKKTENGESIGFFVARKPYIEVWCDGNWNSEEHHAIFDTLDRLWDNEQEIIFYGKNPNIPSDIYHIVEKKARSLESLTIYCNSSVAEFMNRFFTDFKNIKVITR